MRRRLGRGDHAGQHHRAARQRERRQKVLRLIDLLEDHDDVQNVYANFDIPDAILELVEA